MSALVAEPQVRTPSARLAAVLADRPTIRLDELVEQAEMLTRVDRKYVVSMAELLVVLAAVPADARVLEIDGRRVFGYRSTYLDTPDLAAYRAAGQGRRRRFKVRTRTYLDSGASWLEVKTRGSRGTTVKHRIEHHDLDDGPLSPEGIDFVNEALDLGQVPVVRAEDLEPVVVTAYDRATLMLPGGNARVTIDINLSWTGLRGGHQVDVDRPGLAIIETKTGSTPSTVDRLLWAHGHRPVHISKFAAGLAACDPSLARLKWTRTLRRDLAVRPRSEEF